MDGDIVSVLADVRHVRELMVACDAAHDARAGLDGERRRAVVLLCAEHQLLAIPQVDGAIPVAEAFGQDLQGAPQDLAGVSAHDQGAADRLHTGDLAGTTTLGDDRLAQRSGGTFQLAHHPSRGVSEQHPDAGERHRA